MLLMLPAVCFSQNFFTQNARKGFWAKQGAVFAQGFAGGVMDGWNEVAVHNWWLVEKKLGDMNDQWWNPKVSDNNKDDRPFLGRTLFVATSDSYHAFKFGQNITFVGQFAVSFTLWEKPPNWKQIAVQSVIILGSRTLGKHLTHQFFDNK